MSLLSMSVTRKKPTTAVLTNLYDIIKRTIQDNDAYYTKEQIEALKQDKSNIFLERKSK